MAVFTPVSDAEIALWLDQYDVGAVRAFRGIPSGIENSNFFLTTEKDGQTHEYVVTLFERLTFEQLPFYLYLMQHLAQHGISVPAPIPGRDGEILRTLNGKPATMVTRLSGRSNLAPTVSECAIVGDMLARMHLAGRDYPRHQPNLRSLPWWNEVVPDVAPFVHGDTRALLESELAHQQRFFASADYAALPEGPCHCDLFRDNVLFEPAQDGEPERLGGFSTFTSPASTNGCSTSPSRSTTGASTWPPACCIPRGHAPCSRRTTPYARSPLPRHDTGRTCCAPRRIASGSRACGISICRAMLNCSSRMIRPTSSACCANASGPTA